MNEEQYGIIGRSGAILSVLNKIEKFAKNDVPVLITGESGTGKGLTAKAIHEASERRGEYLSLNCGAIPEGMIESELFGHEKGSFTGAVGCRGGMIRAAQEGTLLLDEIGDMPITAQIKLLSVVEDGKVRPVGSDQFFPTDVKIIAATNQDLKKLIKEGKFRKDLFYRLNILDIEIPPLREREEDLKLLIRHFVDFYCEKYAKDLEAIKELCVHSFFKKEFGCSINCSMEEAVKAVEDSNLFSMDNVAYADIMSKTVEDFATHLFMYYYGSSNESENNFKEFYSSSFLEDALKYDWPGNVRQLSSAILKSIILGEIEVPRIVSNKEE